MIFFVSCKVFVGCCKHQFDTVDLIDFAGAGVVVDGNDVCFRMLMAKLFDYAFADNVVWQAAKRLCTNDVRRTLMYQFNHLTGEEPSFAGLIAERNNR